MVQTVQHGYLCFLLLCQSPDYNIKIEYFQGHHRETCREIKMGCGRA